MTKGTGAAGQHVATSSALGPKSRCSDGRAAEGARPHFKRDRVSYLMLFDPDTTFAKIILVRAETVTPFPGTWVRRVFVSDLSLSVAP